jgi:hypothetical protein
MAAGEIKEGWPRLRKRGRNLDSAGAGWKVRQGIEGAWKERFHQVLTGGWIL